MQVFISEDELRKMVNAASHGRKYTPPNKYAALVYANIKRQTKAILAAGDSIDLPAGLP
jgi:hypothetical protein